MQSHRNCDCPNHAVAASRTHVGLMDQSRVYGAQASAKVTVQPSGSIRLSDVQALLLWTLADGVNPKWAFIEARIALKWPAREGHCGQLGKGERDRSSFADSSSASSGV